MDRSDEASSPTWSQLAADLLEGVNIWLPPELASGCLASLEAVTRVAYALVAQCSPPHVVDTCVRTLVACSGVCVEAAEALGGVLPGSKGGEAILELCAQIRPLFEGIAATMAPPAPAAIMNGYDAMTTFLATLATTDKIPEAVMILNILTDGYRRAVDEYSVTGPRANGVGIGSVMWENSRKAWAETGTNQW